MATKRAGMGAAFVVLALVLGLMMIIGVILLMMWFQPGIEHSPSEGSTLRGFHAMAIAQKSDISMFVRDSGANLGALA